MLKDIYTYFFIISLFSFPNRGMWFMSNIQHKIKPAEITLISAGIARIVTYDLSTGKHTSVTYSSGFDVIAGLTW